jgi:hypothetical protein
MVVDGMPLGKGITEGLVMLARIIAKQLSEERQISSRMNGDSSE